MEDRFYASHPVKDIFPDLKHTACCRFEESAFFWCHQLLGFSLTNCSGRNCYCAPFKLQEVVQVTVLPPMHDLQTLTHWFICLAS